MAEVVVASSLAFLVYSILTRLAAALLAVHEESVKF